MKAQDISRFWSKVNKTNECWEWATYKKKNGYGVFSIKHINVYAHRVSAYIAGLIESINTKNLVCHTCDNPLCVNPSHLFIGSAADNMQDKKTKGRCNPIIGESHGSAKLKEDEVVEIKNKYIQGDTTQKQLATQYKVSRTTIGNIINNKNWKHV